MRPQRPTASRRGAAVQGRQSIRCSAGCAGPARWAGRRAAPWSGGGAASAPAQARLDQPRIGAKTRLDAAGGAADGEHAAWVRVADLGVQRIDALAHLQPKCPQHGVSDWRTWSRRPTTAVCVIIAAVSSRAPAAAPWRPARGRSIRCQRKSRHSTGAGASRSRGHPTPSHHRPAQAQ